MQINRDAIKNVIAEQACKPVESFNGDSKIADLDLDSLDMVEAVMMAEDDLNIEVIDFDMDSEITVDQFIDLIEKNSTVNA